VRESEYERASERGRSEREKGGEKEREEGRKRKKNSKHSKAFYMNAI
jgi:hypothetical protein